MQQPLTAKQLVYILVVLAVIAGSFLIIRHSVQNESRIEVQAKCDVYFSPQREDCLAHPGNYSGN